MTYRMIRECLRGDRPSSRREHLKANLLAYNLALGLCGAGFFVLPLVQHLLGYRPQALLGLLLVPYFMRLHEVWATPDNDCPSRGLRGLYWAFYPILVGRHRGLLSHTILIGTPLRCAIAYGPALYLAHWIIHRYGFNADLIAIVKWLLPWWAVAAVLSDLVHFTLDRLGPLEMLFGKPRRHT